MKTPILRLSPLLVLLMLGACASAPRGPQPEIVRLDDQLARLRADPRIASHAPDEIRQAEAAVAVMANEGRRLDEPMFRHGIYLADRRIQIAEAVGLSRYAEQRGKELGVERDRLLVDVRTRQAENSRLVARAAMAEASDERRNADLARADADAARSELDAMRARLTELQTRQTERGLVVTLGDVLFEVDRAVIKPGAQRGLDQLALALHDDPNARVVIEGHTDSTGTREYNMDLSARRAESVRIYLVTHGVDPAHVTATGLGPDYPVASNDSDAGRQQNRRVEVIVNSSVVR